MTLSKWQREALRKELKLARSKTTEGHFVLELKSRLEFSESALLDPLALIDRFKERVVAQIQSVAEVASGIAGSVTQSEWQGKRKIIKGE